MLSRRRDPLRRLGHLRVAHSPHPTTLPQLTRSLSHSLTHRRMAPHTPPHLTHSLSSLARSLTLISAWPHSPHSAPSARPLCTPPATPSHPHPLTHTDPTASKTLPSPPRNLPLSTRPCKSPRCAFWVGCDIATCLFCPHTLARSLARSLACTDSQSMHGYQGRIAKDAASGVGVCACVQAK